MRGESVSSVANVYKTRNHRKRDETRCRSSLRKHHDVTVFKKIRLNKSIDEHAKRTTRHISFVEVGSEYRRVRLRSLETKKKRGQSITPVPGWGIER